MYEDTRELIVRLCTQAGARMEDASVAGVTCAGLDAASLPSMVRDLATMIDDIRAIVAAAVTLSAAGRGR